MLLYLFLVLIITQIHSWLDGYRYRRVYELTNTKGSTLNNYEFDIMVGTNTLISDGHLRGDCYDIMFTDSTDTPLQYWLESACAWQFTTFWIEGDFNVGVNTIYMYYGNSMIGSYQGISWIDSFAFMKRTGCGGNYNELATMYDHLSMGRRDQDFSTTYGSDTHTHATDTEVYSTDASNEVDVQTDGGGLDLPDGDHIHTFTMDADTLSSSTIPPYINLQFCYKDAGVFMDDPLEADLVGMFETAGLVSGWTAYDTINTGNLFVRGSNGGSAGSTVNPTHAHRMVFPADTDTAVGAPHLSTTGGGEQFSEDDHVHNFTAFDCDTLGPSDYPLHRNLHFMYTNTWTPLISGLITLQYCSGPGCQDAPMGWEYYAPLNNVFPRGGGTLNQLGGSDQHRHQFSCETGQGMDPRPEGTSGPSKCAIESHTHFVNDYTPYEIVYPQHKYMRYIKRKDANYSSSVFQRTEWLCFGFVSTDDPNVCSDHGACTAPDNCTCDSEYSTWLTLNCSIPFCYGGKGKAGCSYHGECTLPNTCDCEDDWDTLISNNCSVPKCYGLEGNEGCSHHGHCEDVDDCNCEAEWDTGLSNNCSIPWCFGFEGNEGCSGHGQCVDFDTCDCATGWDGSPYYHNCSVPICNGQPGHRGCSGHGECTFPGNCECQAEWNTALSTMCAVPRCFNEDGDVGCSNHGTCSLPDTCSCIPDWNTLLTLNCSVPFCYGGKGKAGCSYHGECTLPNTCDCEDDWDGAPYVSNCSVPRCYGFPGQQGCSHHGECTTPNVCDCEDDWDTGLSDNCSIPWCFGFEGNEGCDYHGQCFDVDQCDCEDGWATSLSLNCSIPNCFGEEGYSTCNYHGFCYPHDQCECEDDYYETNCSITTCYGTFSNYTSCNQRGNCWPKDVCTCHRSDGWYGRECEEFIDPTKNAFLLYNKSENEVHVVYAVPLFIDPWDAPETTFVDKHTIDCEERFYIDLTVDQNGTTLYGTNPQCWWLEDEITIGFTKELVIKLGANSRVMVRNGQYHQLEVKLVTKDDSIYKYVKSPDEGDEGGLNIGGIVGGLLGGLTGGLIFLIVCGVCCVLCCICIVVVVVLAVFLISSASTAYAGKKVVEEVLEEEDDVVTKHFKEKAEKKKVPNNRESIILDSAIKEDSSDDEIVKKEDSAEEYFDFEKEKGEEKGEEEDVELKTIVKKELTEEEKKLKELEDLKKKKEDELALTLPGIKKKKEKEIKKELKKAEKKIKKEIKEIEDKKDGVDNLLLKGVKEKIEKKQKEKELKKKEKKDKKKDKKNKKNKKKKKKDKS